MRWARGFAGRLAATGAAAIVCALFLGGGGCELAVGDTLPSYTCVPAAHGASDPCPIGSMCVTNRCVPRSCRTGGCASGMQCDPGTLECIASVDGATDASSRHPDANLTHAESGADAFDEERGDGSGDASDGGDADAPTDAGPCRDLACECAGSSACDSGVCALEATVTTPVFDANNGYGFCTKPCCTSADCSDATVCFAAGTGGNYCVPPMWIGRTSPLGAAIGGTACKASSDCRSGLCAGGICADPCCSAATQGAQCAAGTTCRFSAFPGPGFDTHYTASCGAPSGGNLAQGVACGTDRACASDRCQITSCENVCRNSAACGAGFACFYGAGPFMNKDIAAGCVPAGGLGAEGSSCTSNNDCATSFCDTSDNVDGGTMGHCSDVCFADSDCMKGWHCRPRKVTYSPGALYYILACGS